MLLSDIPASSGIYKITCTLTGKFYIGSAVNLRTRCADHFARLQRNVHGNPKMQRAFNKYGREAFTFEVIELVLAICLTAREQYWFNKLKPFGNRGFNIAKVAGSWFGMKHSPETIEKLRNKTVSPEARENIRLSRLGHKQSEETKRKRAEKRIGYKHSIETRQKIGLAQVGHPVKPETRAKLRAANRGKKLDPETIAKLRNASLGNTHTLGKKASPETRTKLSQSHMKTYILTSPDGTEYIVHGLKQFCQEHCLSDSCLGQVAKGKRFSHKGWTARYADPS